MLFLNWILIFGAGAATIPVIIHLFNRSRFRVVPWGAMHLLEPVVRVNRKRIRIEQIILLVVRAMIPVLLAVCMAAPVLTGCENLAGNAKSSLVVVLDNSYSMAAGGANANFDEARQQAIAAIREARSGSDVSVVLMSDAAPILDEPTFKSSLVTQPLSEMTAGYGKADAGGSLQVGSSIISRMQNPKRDMLVVSDFQRISWDVDHDEARARVRQWMGSGALMPSLTFFHVGQQVTDNVAIMDVKFSRLVVGVGQKIRMDVNLFNFGGKRYPSTRVYLEVDHEQQGWQEVMLEPSAAAQARFYHTFTTPGSHVVRFHADADATLKEDNAYLVSVQVLDRIPALLVDGDPSSEPLQGETAFLEVALQPYAQGDVDELADLVEAKVVAANAFDAASLAGVKLIVLANVARLADAQLHALESFVRGGGGLIVFPGDKTDTDWANNFLYSGGTGLLPMKLAQLGGDPTDKSKHASLVTQTYQHPALLLFNDKANGNLTTSEIWTWYKLRRDEGAIVGAAADGRDGGVEILARLNTGDPFLVEKSYGQGRVMLCATACDGDWANLPVRPWYLPLMQQLTSYVASSVEPPRNVRVGQPLIAHLDKDRAGRAATITDPSNRSHPVAIAEQGARAEAAFRRTQQLGLYTLAVEGDKPVHFVVSAPREESDLKQLTRDEIDALAEAMNADVVTAWQDYAALEKTRRHGHEIWHWFFWAVLALCFAELGLQQWFALRK